MEKLVKTSAGERLSNTHSGTYLAISWRTEAGRRQAGVEELAIYHRPDKVRTRGQRHWLFMAAASVKDRGAFSSPRRGRSVRVATRPGPLLRISAWSPSASAFTDSMDEARSEDNIISDTGEALRHHRSIRWLVAGDGQKRHSGDGCDFSSFWPAMPEEKRQIDQFVVAGRLQAALTHLAGGAVDPRVAAIIPIVHDSPIVRRSPRHHFEADGLSFHLMERLCAPGLFPYRSGRPDIGAVLKI